MAGDWIKMRGNLWDDPRVARLCDLTDQTEASIVGALYWLWATADQHTEDGAMPGLTLRQIDRKTGVQGFAAALCEIGWLRDDPDGVVLEKFEEHNGTSAKRRCTDAQRKATSRNVSASEADTAPTQTGQKAPSLGAREEKIREEGKDTEANASVAAKPPRATRKCPESFAPQDPQAWTSEHCPGIDWQAETAKFRDHTFKNPISDWHGAWRNWLRRAFETKQQARASPLTFRERDAANAAARIHEMTGGLVSAKPITRRNDALQEVFDAPRLLG